MKTTPPAPEPSPLPPLVEELAESVRLALRLPYKGEIAHALSQCPRFVRAAKLLAAVERPEPTPLLNRITSICGRHRMSPTGAADALDDLRRDPMVADAAERLARLERERAALADILNRTRDDTDLCDCEDCKRRRVEPIDCEICGYHGPPATLECACYDYSCRGGQYAGTGCPHGAQTCPVCRENEGDVDPWEIIRELRKALAEVSQ